VSAIDQVRAAVNGEFRSTKEISRRAALPAASTAPCLGHLRRRGEVEFKQARRGRSLWRTVGREK
jgi:hypothetical protein